MQTVSFATARRGFDAEALSVAKKMLHKGYGYQNAARIAGINECDLRGIMGAAPARVSKPIPKTPPRLPSPAPAERLPAPAVCCNETLAIIDRVAARYELTRADLIGDKKPRHVAMPRQEAMALVRKHRPHLSYPAIGRIFGGRDHTTIMHGEEKHWARMAWADALIAAGRMDGQLDLFGMAA